MANVVVYSSGYCPFYKMAKATLRGLNVEFQEIDVGDSIQLAAEMERRSGRRTVPQIFINDYHAGGNDDLQAALKNGTLAGLLDSESIVA